METHLANRYWSVGYKGGINHLNELLKINCHALESLEKKLLERYKNILLLKSADLGDEFLTGVDRSLFEIRNDTKPSLNNTINNLLDSWADTNDQKLSFASKFESDILTPFRQYQTEYLNVTDEIKNETLLKLESYEKKVSCVQHLERDLNTKISKIEDITSQLNSLSIEGREESESDFSDHEESDRSFIPSIYGLPTKFPIHLGGNLTLNDLSSLSEFCKSVKAEIPTVRSKVPLTSIQIISFRVGDLVSWISQQENCNRSQIERVGQTLLDLKLIKLSFGKISLGYKFRSDDENVWLEWTEIFDKACHYDRDAHVNELGKARVNQKPPTWKVSGYFSSLVTPTDSKSLRQRCNALKQTTILEYDQFWNANCEMLDARFQLESEVFAAFQRAEQVEKDRIAAVYKVLQDFAKFAHAESQGNADGMKSLLDFSLRAGSSDAQAKELKRFVDFNQPDGNNAKRKLANLSKNTERGGLYCVDPFNNEYLTKMKVSTAGMSDRKDVASYIFGSDVSLQYKESDWSEEKSLLIAHSLPYFLLLIAQMSSGESFLESWETPFDFVEAQKLKSNYYSNLTKWVEEAQGNVDKYVIDQTVASGDKVLLLKCWLLELTEPVIPYLAFEPLYRLYYENSMRKREIPGDQLSAQQIQLLRVCEMEMARANLSCLVGIMGMFGSLDYNQCERLNEGPVPLVHLILRPSPSSALKEKDGYVSADRAFYNNLLFDLANANVQERLKQILIEKEVSFKERDERVRERDEKRRSRSSTATSSDRPSSGLRPFSLGKGTLLGVP